MSYSNNGNRRPSYGQNRSFAPQRRGPRPAYINPARYTNQARTMEREAPVEIMHTFEDFNLEPQLLANVKTHGYTIPTPIQDQGIPVMMSGRDLVGIANTGTGKTAAFLLPLIDRILKDPTLGVLVVVPTRELAVQITEELTAFTRGLRITNVIAVGGVSIIPQIERLRRDPHFVIGTPGRLKDLIMRNAFKPALYTNIVLDEVDRMLDIGFIKDIQFLISQLPPVRNSYFFSATMTPEVTGIMNSLMNSPITISVKTKETSEHIAQDVIRLRPGENKIDVLHDMLISPEFQRVIVFGRTKHGINKLEEVLSSRGVKVCAIHGNKSQNARQQALTAFKRGYTQALLATDVAARGIDIEGVTHVINYDEPNSYEDYIHRIGRTGRAGKTGKALTFVG